MSVPLTSEGILAAHGRHRRARRWINGGTALLILVLASLELAGGLAHFAPGLVGWINLAIPALLLWTLVQKSYWRCPGCERVLSENDPNFCSRCGVQLHALPTKAK